MKLADWLQHSDMTQQQFAETIGSTQGQVSRYCNGQAIPTRSVMLAIIKATRRRVLPDDFYTDDLDAAG